LIEGSINLSLLLQLCGMSSHLNPRVSVNNDSLEELTEVINMELLSCSVSPFLHENVVGNYIHLALEAAS